MRKRTCLLLIICLLLAAGRLAAQDCVVTISTSTGSTQLNCKDENITLTAPEGFVAYAWKKAGDDAVLSTTNKLEKISLSGTYTVSVTGDNPLCNASSSITITEDKNLPAIDVRAIPATICKGSTAVLLALAPGAVAYSWAAGSTENPVYIKPDQTAAYTVTVTGANGCMATSSVTVEVNPLPEAVIIPPATVCKGVPNQVVTFAGSGSAGMPGTPPFTFTYNIEDGATQTITTTSGNTATIGIPANELQTIRYKLVSVKDGNGCSNPVQQGEVAIAISQGALLTSEKNIVLCNNTPFGYKAVSTDNAAAFKWTRPAVAGISGAVGEGEGPDINETLNNSDTLPKEVKYIFTIRASSGCITSDTVKLTVNPTPQIKKLDDSTFCNGSFLGSGIPFYSSTPNTFFSWTNSNPNIGLPAGGDGNIDPFVAKSNSDTAITAVINVRAFLQTSAGTCTGANSSFGIRVVSAPYILNSKNTSVCNDAPLLYTAASSVGSLRWTRPAVAGISNPPDSANGAVIKETLHNTDSLPKLVKYVFTLTAGAGCAVSDTVKVVVNPSPVLRLAVRDAIVCNQMPFRDTATSTAANPVFKWVRNAVDKISNRADSATSPFLDETLVNTDSLPRMVTYRFTLSDRSGCTTNDAVKLTVNPTPAINPVLAYEYCRSTNAPGINFKSPSPGASFTWTNNDQRIGLPAGGTGNIPPFVAQNNTDAPISAQITVTSFIINGSDSCAGTTRTFRIMVRPAPVLDTPKIKTVCSGYPLEFTANSSTSGTNFKWVRDAVDKISNKADSAASAAITETLYNTDSLPKVVTYRFALSAGAACSGTDSVKVTVYPTPEIAPVADSTVCNGSFLNSGIRFRSTTPNTSFYWTNDNAKIGLAAKDSGNIPPFTAINTSAKPDSAIILVSAKSADGCSSQKSRAFKIFVKPSPPKPGFTSLFRYADGGTLELCKGSENINFHVNAPAQGIAYRWASIPLNGVRIRNPQDSATVISFDEAGNYSIQLTATDTSKAISSAAFGCTNSATQIVKVDTTQALAKQKILPFNGNLLIYPDNSPKAYQWGYDPIIGDSSRHSYGRSVLVPGQIYQFFVPPAQLIDQAKRILNTANYTYWVQLQSEVKNKVCETRVYYNGLYANRVMAIAPVSDTVTLQVVPNPNKGYFRLLLSGQISGKIEARIRDAAGRLVFSKSFTKAAPAVTEIFSLGNLPGGIYFLTLQSSDLKTVVSRFVIQ